MTRQSFRLGWMVGVVMVMALACTCGPLSQATQGVQTAQAVASQAQGLATKAVGIATQADNGDAFATAGAVASQVSSGGVPDDIPIYSDHQNLVTVSGTAGYQAKADLQTVIEFYQTEMINKGWKQAADPVTTDTAAVLSYQKGDRQATINLAYTGGVTAVGIQYTP